MVKMYNIVCVLWEGDFRSRDYSVADVDRLFRMCKKWASPHKFWCLTNAEFDIEGINTIPLKHPDKLKGWWAKVELFRDDLPFNGRVLYIDLDTYITGNLDEIVNYQDELCFMPQERRRRPKPHKQRRTVPRYQSSCFSWKAENYNIDIESVIDTNQMSKYRGDQDYFGTIFNAGIYPAKWFRKLRDCYKSGPPKDCKIVLGNPKMLWDKSKRKKLWRGFANA